MTKNLQKLTKTQLERFSRQLAVPEIGLSGQTKLQAARVLVIGVGGLGSAAAYYLAAAGIGQLGLVDSDKVELSNLQRQILHNTADLGKIKVQSAKAKLKKLDPALKIETFPLKLTAKNIDKILADHDFILDCTDNFDTKFLINDACVKNRKPFCHTGVIRWQGQALTYLPGETCYRCVFGEKPPVDALPTNAALGIVGVTAGLFGCLQASEAIKFILGQGQLLTNKLLQINLLNLEFRIISISKNKECSACGNAND